MGACNNIEAVLRCDMTEIATSNPAEDLSMTEGEVVPVTRFKIIEKPIERSF